MTPGAYSLQLYRGDTYRWQFIFWTDADNTMPADLSNATPKAEIRDRPGGAVIVPLTLALTLPNIIDASLTAAQTSDLPVRGAWDLQLTYTNGDVATVLAGPVTVNADVTDSSNELLPADADPSRKAAVRGARRAP